MADAALSVYLSLGRRLATPSGGPPVRSGPRRRRGTRRPARPRRTARPPRSVTSSTTPPASRRSPSAARRASSRPVVSVTVSTATGGPHRPLGRRLGPADRPEHLGGHLQHGVASVDRVGRRRPDRARPRWASGAVWIEPARHHDQTSSVTKGRNGASRRSCTERASGQRRPGRGGARLGRIAVGAGLDQLQVVVAERPEERLGALEGPGVVVPLERRGGLRHHPGQPAEHGPVDRGGHRLGPGDHQPRRPRRPAGRGRTARR